MNKNEKEIISEEEITLAPEKELRVIKNDTGSKKYPMILKYSKAEDKQKLMQVLSELKCPIVEIIDFAKCIVCDLTKAEIEKIKKYDFVESVERNYKYDLLEIENNHKNDNRSDNHNITHKSLENLKARKETRKKVKVAVFDTGIDKHPDLTIAGGVSFVGKGRSFTDSDGHGTKMAGIIASAENKEADTNFIDLYAVKVFDDTGHATTTSIVRAISWAIDNKIDIINMSFGTYYPSKLLKKYTDMAIECGIIIVAAVGNDGGFKGRHRIMYPAKYDNVIAVGAGDAYGTATFSNNSIDLDFVAPGTTISTDINGEYSSITGTSVSCAYITSMLASLWSINKDIASAELISIAKRSGEVKNANASYVGYGEIDAGIALTSISDNNIIKTNKASVYSAEMLSSVSDTTYSTPVARTTSYSAYSNCDSNLNDDFMPSAIPLNLFEFTEISYTQLEQGVWYKFIADELSAHPGIGRGFYHIYTYGQSDTIGKLYDSRGNLIAYNEGDSTNSWRGFEIYAELKYADTYYVYVEEKDLAGGKVSIKVEPIEDDYGNSMSSATYLGDVYTQNFSVSGFLHNAIDYYQNGDLDYFYFRSSKDCVVEVYSEGSSEVYGTIFDSNGVVDLDTFDIVNDDFKLTFHMESGKMYYIEISKLSNFGYATDYTFNVKFLKDYSNNIIDEQYRVMYWYANNQDEYPEMGQSITRNKVYVSNKAKSEFEIRVLEDRYDNKTLLEEVLENGTAQDVLGFLLDTIISSIPVVGDAVSYAFNVGSIIYGFMSSANLMFYQQKTKEIENTNQYIIGEKYWFTDYPNGLATGMHTTYSVGSGVYYGAEYQKGIFIETYMKN